MEWKNRIVGYATKPADQFQAHPDNPRVHPMAQRAAVKGSLDELGWYDVAIENKTTGNLIDGHERVWQALANGNAEVPYLIVELSENEERLALTTHDFMTGMADYDREAVERLLHEVNTTSGEMQKLLADIAEETGVINLGDVRFDEYDESAADDVKQVTCPHCGERFAA